MPGINSLEIRIAPTSRYTWQQVKTTKIPPISEVI